MAFDKTAFMNDIFSGVNVDETAKAALDSVLSNPVIAKRVEESTLRQSDYSKKLDDYNKKVQAAADYHASLVQWDKESKAKFEQEQKLLRQKLVDEGIDLNNPTPDTFSKAEYEEKLKQLASQSLSYMNTISRLQGQHMKEFNEVLDPDKLMEVSQRDGVNINIAYDRFVQPEREKLRQAEVEKQLAQAREEGKAEAIKNYQIPVGDAPLNNTANFNINGLDASRKSEYGAMAAVKAWEDSRRKGTPAPF